MILEEPSKVLFLDVDGVLNHRGVFTGGAMHVICPDAWRRCKEVIEATGAAIVLSSTWRRGDLITDAGLAKLREIGLFELTHWNWRTRYDLFESDYPPGQKWYRGYEIEEWLKRHPEVTRYAIVDDDSDMLWSQRPFFVQTSFDVGMLDAHRDRLIEILGRKE
jgi:hypothetical protein